MTFSTFAKASGVAPRIAVNNGYCFAGNAVLFGCADITIATKSSYTGMGGPAMIEGGGLGVVAPTELGCPTYNFPMVSSTCWPKMKPTPWR